MHLIQSLGLTAAKNMHHMKKKASNKSCSKLNFVRKSLRRVYLSLPRVELWAQKIDMVEILYCTERQNTFNLGLNSAKSMYHMKKTFK